MSDTAREFSAIKKEEDLRAVIRPIGRGLPPSGGILIPGAEVAICNLLSPNGFPSSAVLDTFFAKIRLIKHKG